jgi:hypothetical protein
MGGAELAQPESVTLSGLSIILGLHTLPDRTVMNAPLNSTAACRAPLTHTGHRPTYLEHGARLATGRGGGVPGFVDESSELALHGVECVGDAREWCAESMVQMYKQLAVNALLLLAVAGAEVRCSKPRLRVGIPQLRHLGLFTRVAAILRAALEPLATDWRQIDL